MDPTKTVIAGVGINNDGFRFILIAVKTGGSFATADIGGTWRVYAYGDNPTGNAPGWARGPVTLDGTTGSVTGSSNSLNSTTGITVPVTSGSVTVSNTGIVTGSFIPSFLGQNLSPVELTEQKMDPAKTKLFGVGFDNNFGVQFISAIMKMGGTFATGDLNGQWYVYAFSDRRSTNLPDWLKGTMTLDNGTITTGSLTNSAGATTGISNGSLTSDSDGIVTGSLTKADTGVLTLTELKLDPGKVLLAGVGTTPAPAEDRFLVVAIKALEDLGPRLVAISTRGVVQAVSLDQEANAMIAGFSITGSTAKTVVIRARGPALASFGVQGTLADPFVKILNGQTTLAQNDDWQSADPTSANTGNQCGTASDITNVGLSPCSPIATGCEKEAALHITLQPGQYTAIARGASGNPGIGIVEVYEVGAGFSKLIAISTRSAVQAVSLQQEGNAMIAGFSVTGQQGTFKTVVIRARGPSLAAFGVQGALTDPFVKVLSGQATLAQNDDWQTADPTCANTGNQCGTSSDIVAAGLSPCSPNTTGCEKEAAIQIRLPPGSYTAIARGASGDPGIGIIEVYDVGN